MGESCDPITALDDCRGQPAGYIAEVKKLGPVAVIGAGLAGLSCAQALQAAGVAVHVFESSANIGGRCATQLWQGHLVDLGVQYFTAESADFKRELLTRLRQFRPIVSAILDVRGNVVPSPLGPRFYVLQGNNYFAHVLAQGLDVRLNQCVEKLTVRGDGIECLGTTYRAVVSALPAPITAGLLGSAHAGMEYDPSLVALLEYTGLEPNRTRECYGRVTDPGDEPLAASYCENSKVGRIVGNKTIFVVEASPGYSRQYLDAPPDHYLPELVRRHEELWGLPPGKLMAGYGHAWRYNRPIPASAREVDLPAGVFVCGDSRAVSTVEGVWVDGRKAAEEVWDYLEKAAQG
jgi:predicted NAD/FAD-dependent oxidoreductase